MGLVASTLKKSTPERKRAANVAGMNSMQSSRQSWSNPSARQSWSDSEEDFSEPNGSLNYQDDDELDAATSAAMTVAEREPDPDVSSIGPVTLRTRVEYSALPRGHTQDVFGLVTVQAAVKPDSPDDIIDLDAPDLQGSQPMDIVCVLDVSGSMRGAKIQQLQDAVRFVIGQASAKDRLSIVTFNSSASRELRFRKMDAIGKDSANVATLRLEAGGGTSIAAGLSMGIQVMEQRRQRNKVSAIMLLTDGQDSTSSSTLRTLLTRAEEARCAVYAFGFGKDHDAALLSRVAEMAQTPFTYVEDIEKVGEAFAGAVGGLASIVAQGLELRIRSHVPLKALHTPFRVQRISDTEATVHIPDVFAGERRDVLVELAVPAAGDGSSQMVLLEATARYTDLQRSCTVETAPAVMTAERVEEPQPEAEPDAEVSEQRERVQVTRALQEAVAQSDLGNLDDARKVLASAEASMKTTRNISATGHALREELQDAHERMASQSAWEQGGRAEVNDAWQMHSKQRCTNAMQSSGSRKKSSKSMYLSHAQDDWISRSRA